MKLFRLLKAAWRALRVRKLRTGLATLGIAIGVAAVVAVVSIGEGTKAEVLRTIESLGSDLLIVTAGRTRISAGRRQGATDVTTLTVRDAEAIAEEVPGVRAAVPSQSRKLPVVWEDAMATSSIVAVPPEFEEVRNFRASQGEFIDEGMVKSTARVAVLGETVVGNVFGTNDPIGARIRIDGAPFQVIGVMEEKGLDISGVDQDDQVFIPVSTGLRRLFNVAHVRTIYVQAVSADVMESVAVETRYLLHERHRLREDAEHDFSIQNQSELIAAQREISSSLTLLLSSVGGISLFVGGVGILAVTVISVRERTREIGIRRAVGATRTDILIQFLAEAAALSLVGGMLGLVVGVLAAWLTALLTQWGMALSVPAALGALFFSLAIGIVFGLYPARRASLLSPVEALRSE